jgi:glutamate/aspartate transport system substrate-binding protein
VITQLISRFDENALAVLPDDFSFEPYGIVVRREDPEFRLAVNRALVGIYKRGDIDAIFQRWLAPLGKPSALLNAMFYLNSLPE